MKNIDAYENNEVRSPKYFDESFYLLAGNCGEQLDFKEYANYYVNGRCSTCNLSYGKRTDRNIVVNFKVPSTDSISIDHSNVIIFSERLLEVLDKYNKDLFSLKAIEFERREKGVFRKYKMKGNFYEVIWCSDLYKTDSVAVKDNSIGVFHGWKCSNCLAHGSFYQDELGLAYYVSKDFIQDKKPDLFLLNNKTLCVSERVKKDLEILNLKFLNVDLIGVVDKDDIDFNPTIEIRYPKEKVSPKLP